MSQSITQSIPPAAAHGLPWASRMAATFEAWRWRWPAAFTRPVPLAIGISRQIKAALRTEGLVIDRKSIGIVMHRWTTQKAYLRAMARGDVRRNLDGSEAGIPDVVARKYAQKLLRERTAQRAERNRRQEMSASLVGAGVGAVGTQQNLPV